jgi:hypothetical protein
MNTFKTKMGKHRPFPVTVGYKKDKRCKSGVKLVSVVNAQRTKILHVLAPAEIEELTEQAAKHSASTGIKSKLKAFFNKG